MEIEKRRPENIRSQEDSKNPPKEIVICELPIKQFQKEQIAKVGKTEKSEEKKVSEAEHEGAPLVGRKALPVPDRYGKFGRSVREARRRYNGFPPIR